MKMKTALLVGLACLTALAAPVGRLRTEPAAASACGDIEGHFKGRFWHYYLRGNSYSTCEMWDKAEADYREAIKQREQDQEMAKTYGLYFIDYFPHRELGVVCFRQGKLEQAQTELELSYSSQPSARAAFYLNQVRRALVLQSGGDSTLPEITLELPPAKVAFSAFKIPVRGLVRDPARVSSIEVNGQPVMIELAEKERAFEVEVALGRGEETIQVKAEDLFGNQKVATVPVRVDREGPQVSIEEIKELRPGTYSIRGTLMDDSGVASFKLAGLDISLGPGQEVPFQRELKSESSTVSFEAVDRAGNRTRGDLTLNAAARPKGAWGPAPRQYASLSLPDALPFFVLPELLVQASAGGPGIQIKGLRKEESVYLDQIVVEGKVSSEQPVTELRVQEQPILQRPGQNVYFSTLVPLQAGANTIKLAAADQGQHRSEEQLHIQRLIQKVHDVGSRFSISVMPFAHPQVNAANVSIIQSKFLHYLTDQHRFAVVEREKLEAVLSEMKLSQEKLADPETSIRIGKLVAANGMIFGEIHETKNSLEVVARLVDTETGQIVFSRDGYTENLDLKALDGLCERLAWKFLQAYPLLEGTAIKFAGQTVYTDLGSAQGLTKPMQIIIFKLGKEIVHPVTGESLGADTEEIGTAFLTSVEEKFSKAELRSPVKAGQLAPGLKIITR